MNPDHALPGYEDAWYYLWKERRLPINVDPLDSKLSNPEDRARLAKVFEQGLDKVVGYALPLRREYYDDDTNGWSSGTVVPASRANVPDSRRFADGLPVAARFDAVGGRVRISISIHEQDPMEERPPLRTASGCRGSSGFPAGRSARSPLGFVEQALESGPGSTRSLRRRRPEACGARRRESRRRGSSAPRLCTEVRGGALRVFMPPQRYLEDYLELVSGRRRHRGEPGNSGAD